MHEEERAVLLLTSIFLLVLGAGWGSTGSGRGRQASSDTTTDFNDDEDRRRSPRRTQQPARSLRRSPKPRGTAGAESSSSSGASGLPPRGAFSVQGLGHYGPGWRLTAARRAPASASRQGPVRLQSSCSSPWRARRPAWRGPVHRRRSTHRGQTPKAAAIHRPPRVRPRASASAASARAARPVRASESARAVAKSHCAKSGINPQRRSVVQCALRVGARAAHRGVWSLT